MRAGGYSVAGWVEGTFRIALDAKTNQRLATISLGGGAGNTQYDSASEHIFVTVHAQNELAAHVPGEQPIEKGRACAAHV